VAQALAQNLLGLRILSLLSKRAARACPVVAREAFLVGTEPPLCDEHRGVIDHVVNGWNRLTEWFRRSRHELPPATDWVVIARAGAAQLDPHATRAELTQLARR
jgi:hypothetical protein